MCEANKRVTVKYWQYTVVVVKLYTGLTQGSKWVKIKRQGCWTSRSSVHSRTNEAADFHAKTTIKQSFGFVDEPITCSRWYTAPQATYLSVSINCNWRLHVSLSPKALLPSSQTKYPTFVCLFPATPIHHLHTHPLLLQHLLISPLSHLLLNLTSSRLCLTVLTCNLILILSPLGFSRNAHLF